VMNGIHPGGVRDGTSDTVFWVGVADYMLFTMLILATGFGFEVKIPATIFTGVFMMDFLNPKSEAVYSAAWGFNVRGVAFSIIVQFFIGAGLGVLTNLVPYPLFALDKARDISLNLVEELAEAWQAGIKSFASATSDVIDEATLQHEMDRLSSDVNSLGGLADASWYECMGLPGKPQRVRVMLSTLTGTIQASYTRLANVHHLCKVSEKTPEHVELMTHMKPHLENLSKQSSDLLNALVEGAIDGGFDDDERALTKDLHDKVEQALTTVAEEFHKKRGKMKSDLFDVASFCLSYSARARQILDFHEQEERGMNSEVSLRDNLKAWAKDQGFSILHDVMAQNCWLRSTVAIFLCFFIGLRGYGKILPSYSAMLTETACLMLSAGLTPQFKNNLDRFLSVVVGTVYGQIAYSILGWCSVWAKSGIVLFIIMYSFTMLFMMNHYGQVLLCGFMLLYGLIGVLIPCSDELFEAGGSSTLIIGTTIAITIKVFVDMLLARTRASDAALNTLVSAWDQLEKAVINFFDPEVKAITFTGSAIAGAFNTAKELSGDADKELRYWWCDWKHNSFVQTCDAGVKISNMLSSLETTFCKTGNDGDVKANALTIFQKLESSAKVKEDLIMRIEGLRNLCFMAFSYTKTDFFAAHYEKPKNLDDCSTLVNRVYEVASKAAKERDETGQSLGKKNLDHDLGCKMGTFITNVQGMQKAMEEMEIAILCS